MNYKEVIENARPDLGPFCKGCEVCNGKACKNQVPGPGAKGRGDTAVRNYEAWSKIRLNMDTLVSGGKIETKVNLFGREFKAPIFAGPVGAIQSHYGMKYDDLSYNDILVRACANAGIAAFTGDGKKEEVVIKACSAIKNMNGLGIPTIKPWDINTIEKKMKLAVDANAFAIAMDIDAAGLPFLKNNIPPAGSKNVSEMKEIISLTDKPFIIKGIMTVKGALKAIEAGASAIIVSNHGGRVLDDCMATAEVLEDICKAVDHKILVFVDGGIRSGADVFKALALGADGVLIARPFVTALFGGEDEGINIYINKIIGELEDAMQLTGCHSISEIDRSMVTLTK